MGKGGGSPPPRNLSNEFGQIADSSGIIFGQERQMGQQLGQDQLKYDSQYANLLADQIYPKLSVAEVNATNFQRAGDIVGLHAYGPRIEQQIGRINPEWQASLDRLNAASQQQAAGPSPLLGQLNQTASAGLDRAGQLGPSALRMQLEQQANSDLALGRNLSPEQQRDVTQASRAAYAARGLTDSNPALINEVMQRDQYATALQNQRRAFAGQTQQLAQNEDMALTNQGIQLGNFGSQVQGLNQAQQSQNFNTQLAAQQANQNALNPTLGFFGRSVLQPSNVAGVMSSAPNIMQAGTQAMQPILSYGQDLFNTNFNAQAAARNSAANSSGSTSGAAIGAIGSIIGGLAMACWVAREVYGEERLQICGAPWQKWILVRRWLSRRAPHWLWALYLAHGEAFAEWLRPHPRIKRLVRKLMDRAVASEIIWIHHEIDTVTSAEFQRRLDLLTH